MARCTHRDSIHVEALTAEECASAVCADCVESGDDWEHLRQCRTCGAVHCCDSSPNRHASKHAARAGHPIITSAEPGERWSWCYVDETPLKV